MLSGVSIGNTVEMLDRGKVLHEVLLLLLLLLILVCKVRLRLILHEALHPTLVAEMSALGIGQHLWARKIIIHACRGLDLWGKLS